MSVLSLDRGGLPVIVMAAFLSVLLGSSSGWGYRFYPSFSDASLIADSDDARRWRRNVWGPGDTLLWYVLDSPEWETRFPERQEAVDLIEESLATWSRVPGADIRWRVGGILSGRQMGDDGLQTVSVDEDLEAYAVARWWSKRESGGPWETVDCDVVLSGRSVARLAGGGSAHLQALLHEFGHCVGLSHAATTPTARWNWAWTDSSVWQQDPTMAYGRSVDNELSEDEVIGGSLLRPAPGWQRTRGGLAGRVTLAGGQPARFVSVEVLRNDGGTARPAVQVFTDEEGQFLAEGLEPGEYVLWIHPMFRQTAHQPLLSNGAVTDARDLVSSRRHHVGAGYVTIAGDFTLTRGRDQR